jgi:looped-hinge helix DNA binding domain, AbrB family
VSGESRDMADRNERFAATVKVGIKGQIVIPQAARAMFDIKSGDTLLLLADPEKGIAIVRTEVFNHFIESITKAKAGPPEDPDA